MPARKGGALAILRARRNGLPAPLLICLALLLSIARADDSGAAQTEPDQQAIRLDVNEYDVEGNSVLAAEEIEGAVYPFLGPQRTVQDINDARAALERAYREKGYQTVSVELPNQKIVDGLVIFVVRERRVARIQVAGAEHRAPESIAEAVPSLAAGAVPNTIAADREIQLLNRTPDRQVKAGLGPGAEPGTVDVHFHVQDRLPLHGSLEINNQYSPGTKPYRLIGTAEYTDLWGLGHTIQGGYLVAPQARGNAELFQGAYVAPLDQFWTAQITGATSSSNVATGGSSMVLGNGDMIQLRLSYALPADGGLTQSLFAELDYKHFLEGFTTINGVPSVAGPSALLFPVTYYPLAAGYSGTIAESDATDRISVTLDFALRGVGAHLENLGLGRRNFFYLHGEAERLQALPWGAELSLKATGQIASDRLPTHEQFSLGGMGSVRGYLESEEIADDALGGSIELRSPSFGADIAPAIDSWRIFGFTDAVTGWLHAPLPFERRSFGLMSAGLGTSIELFERWNGVLDLAWPLQDGPLTRAGDLRTQFRLWTAF